jgi:hypothetical protein
VEKGEYYKKGIASGQSKRQSAPCEKITRKKTKPLRVSHSNAKLLLRLLHLLLWLSNDGHWTRIACKPGRIDAIDIVATPVIDSFTIV